MNTNEFRQLGYRLKLKGLSLPRLYTTDMVRHHSRGRSGETMKHWICKCIVSKILYDCKHPHLCEYEFPDKTTADVFDMKDMVVIELETGGTQRKQQLKLLRYRHLLDKKIIRDLYIINISTLPDNPLSIERELRKKLHL